MATAGICSALPSQPQPYPPPLASVPPDTRFPPAPNAPPTSSSTASSYNGSTCPTPSQCPAPMNHQQWSANEQPPYYQSVGVPPRPGCSPSSTGESRTQSTYQVPVDLTLILQYTSAAHVYGSTVPQAPGQCQTSYFPQQPSQTQPAPAHPAGCGQDPPVTCSPAIESFPPDLSKLSLDEQQQAPSRTPPNTYPSQGPNLTSTSASGQCADASEDKAQLQPAYAQPSPSITYSQAPQYATQPVAVQVPSTLPPPPYSPYPQADQNLHPLSEQEIQPQHPQAIYTQQQTQYQEHPQYWQQQLLQQTAQTYVQQQTPYYGSGQQHQYTQVQLQNSVLGLQQPQYAQAHIQQFQQVQPIQQVQPAQQVQSTYGQDAPPSILAHEPGKDDEKTGSVTRFFGDTLFGRFARSSVSTVTTTLKMPAVLSPWGDNNPVTLPSCPLRHIHGDRYSTVGRCC